MDAKTRKKHPLYSGLIKYFPDACMAVANCSYVGNEQHNRGQPMHWAREKSKDHEDCLLRHLMDAKANKRQRAWADGDDKENGEPTGEWLPPGVDSDGVRHSVKAAWRSLAIAQLELEGAREVQGSPVSAVPDLEPFRFRCATVAEDGTTKTPKDGRRERPVSIECQGRSFRTNGDGTIDERDALGLEAEVQRALDAAYISHGYFRTWDYI